jgi:hypothetical protein
MRKRTPQEKKALSYAHDRRNCYAENDKTSRKAIRLRKAHTERAYRRVVNQTLQSESPGIDVDAADELENKVRGKRRRDWHKIPDEPLGEVVKGILERRRQLEEANAKRREAAEKLKEDA